MAEPEPHQRRRQFGGAPQESACTKIGGSVQRIHQAIRHALPKIARNYGWCINADSRIFPRLELHPTEDLLRQFDAIECSEIQRFVSPIQGCNAAGFLPSETDSQEAQKLLF